MHVVFVALALVAGHLHIKADFFQDMEACERFKARVAEVVPKTYSLECKVMEETPEEKSSAPQ